MNIFDKRPLFLIITVMISGFVAFTFSDGIIRGLLLSCAILAIILSLFFYYKKKVKNLLFIIIPIILLFSMICSYLYFDVHFNLYDQYPNEVEIEGKIISMEEGDYSTDIIVKTSKINQKNKPGYKVRLNIPNYSLNEEFVVGTKVVFNATLSEFEDFSDIDASSYYFADGISADTTNIKNLAYIGKGIMPLSAYAEYLRFQIMIRSEDLTGEKASSLFFALFLGERDLLDDQIKLDFKRLGITHILALSGLHLSIISLGITKILSAAKVKKKLRLVIVSAFILLYMMLTGLSVSVVRAGIMILIYSALFLLGKTKDSLTSLSIAVLIILIFTPYAIYDLALWLSALSTLGIVAMGNLEVNYEPNKKLLKSILDGILSSLKASMFATSATLLVTASTFGALSLASAIATLIFSLLAEVIIYLGMLMLIFGKIVPIGALLYYVSEATYSLANIMAYPDWIYLRSEHILVKGMIVAYTVAFALFLSLCFKNKKKASLILTICFTIVMLISVASNLVYANNDIAIYNMYDDGDRIILRSNGKVALISSTGYSSSNAYDNYKLLESNNITYLNMYYLTGYSSGLVHDVVKIISLMKVDAVYIPQPQSESEEILLEDLTDNLNDRSTIICLYNLEEEVIWSEYKICALHRTVSGARYPKNAFSISKGQSKLLYLSAGMMQGKEMVLSFSMIADCDIVLFGSKDYKKYNAITFDIYNEDIEKIYIGNKKLDIKENISKEYENSGTTICRDATINLFD